MDQFYLRVSLTFKRRRSHGSPHHRFGFYFHSSHSLKWAEVYKVLQFKKWKDRRRATPSFTICHDRFLIFSTQVTSYYSCPQRFLEPSNAMQWNNTMYISRKPNARYFITTNEEDEEEDPNPNSPICFFFVSKFLKQESQKMTSGEVSFFPYT